MKKFLLGILFTVVFCQATFAFTYNVLTPDGRVLGPYDKLSFPEVSVLVEQDRIKNNLQDYIYRVYIDNTQEYWTIGIKDYESTIKDAYLGISYKNNYTSTEDLITPGQERIFTGPNVIYAPIFEEIPKWENTGIKHPYKLNRGMPKPEIKRPEVKPEILYSPGVQNK